MTGQQKQDALIKKLKEVLPGHYYDAIVEARSESEALSLLPTRYHRIVEQAVAELEKLGEEDAVPSEKGSGCPIHIGRTECAEACTSAHYPPAAEPPLAENHSASPAMPDPIPSVSEPVAAAAPSKPVKPPKGK